MDSSSKTGHSLTAPTMKLLTWNLNGLDDHRLDERTEAAVFVAIAGARLDQLSAGTTPSDPPDVLLFQEVVERSFFAHIRPHLLRAGYMMVPKSPPARQTFEVVAIRKPFAVTGFSEQPLDDSVFGRVLHRVGVSGPLGELSVLTAHFDSGTESGAVRTKQLQQVASSLGARGVFGGDANLRKAEWEAVRDSIAMRDAWELLGEPPKSRVTWKSGEFQARFDRIWLGSELTAVSIKAIGGVISPGSEVDISDHYGLLVEIAAVGG